MILSNEILLLADLYRDNALSESQARRLAELLHGDPDTRRAFMEHLAFCGYLGQAGGNFDPQEFTRVFWQRVMAEESTGQFSQEFDALTLSTRLTGDACCSSTTALFDAEFRELVDKDLDDSAIRPHPLSSGATENANSPGESLPRLTRPGRREIAVFLGQLAAIVMVAVLLIFLDRAIMRAQYGPTTLATIIDAVDARWADNILAPAAGDRLRRDNFVLTQGLIRIRMESGALALIQAPSCFTLENDKQIFLKSGVLTANVPKEAIGFLVRSTGASVVDYGTEFGIIAHNSGLTKMLVFNGEVEFRRGSDAVCFDESRRLTQGQACQISTNGQISETSVSPDQFIRTIPSNLGFGRPGHLLNLADIVGGGNGYNTGSFHYGINPLNGKLEASTVEIYRAGSGRYFPVPDSPFIDGVFVPDPNKGDITITSEGHVLADLPATSGLFYSNITNINGYYLHDSVSVGVGPLHFGTLDHPAIAMHTNAGITFDLRKIRAVNPGVVITRFTAVAGLCNISRKIYPRADIRVLVDGDTRFLQLGISTDDPIAVDIPLSPISRFLTLITTDGGDVLDPKMPSNHWDWCLFGDPALVLETPDTPMR